MSLQKLLIDEPYRLFFPLGWIFGLLGAAYWIAVSLGWAESYLPIYHGLIQIELFGFGFATGFLLTALPKFFRAAPPSGGEVKLIIAVYSVLAAAILFNLILISQFAFITLLLLLIRFAVVRFKDRKGDPPYSFLLVGFGLLQGLLGAILLMFPNPGFPLLGQKFLEQGMLLSLSLGIGSFLGPRLMGVVDTENAVVSLPGRLSRTASQHSPAIVVFLIGFLIFVSFPIETSFNRYLGFSIRAMAAVACLYRFGVLKIPKSQSIVGVLTALALWQMALGIIIAEVLPSHEVGALHLMYIGGFGLLILTIGAQVISSHGGAAGFWHVHKSGAIVVFVLMCISAILRLSITFLPNNYFTLLGSGAFTFDLALIFWGFGVLKHVLSKTATKHIQG